MPALTSCAWEYWPLIVTFIDLPVRNDLIIKKKKLFSNFLMIVSKVLLMILKKRLGKPIFRRRWALILIRTFHKLGKNFFFNQLWNNFDKIEDNTGLIFLKIINRILSEPVAFLETRILISLGTSRAVIEILLWLCSLRVGTSGRGCRLSSNVVTLVMKSFASSEADKMTSLTFITVDSEDFTSIKNTFSDFCVSFIQVSCLSVLDWFWRLGLIARICGCPSSKRPY